MTESLQLAKNAADLQCAGISDTERQDIWISVCHRSCVSEWQRMKPFVSSMKIISVFFRKWGQSWLHFSPIHDEHLPADLDGILLYGGYPELNGEALERNASMKEEIAQAVKQGMPCMAECGGFMYLHEQMEDMDGVVPENLRSDSRKMLPYSETDQIWIYHINRQDSLFWQKCRGDRRDSGP